MQAQRRLGARIRQVREEVGWNQREAARVFGFASNGAVSNLEHGLNGIDAIDLYAFAHKTNYPVEFFLDPNFEERTVNWPRNLMEWTLWKMVRNLADYAGVENCNVHRFRHTAASELFNETLNIKLVQSFLGHSKVATTDRYLKRIGVELEQRDYATPDSWLG